MLILCLLHPNEFESTRNFGSSLGGADPSHTKSRIEVVLSPQRTTVQCRPRIVSCVANPKKDDHVLLVRASAQVQTDEGIQSYRAAYGPNEILPV